MPFSPRRQIKARILPFSTEAGLFGGGWEEDAVAGYSSEGPG